MRSIYSYVLRTNLSSDAGYNAKLHKNAYKCYFCWTDCIFLHQAWDQIKEERNKKSFRFFFLATFEQLSLQKATFDFFWSNFWAPFREISGNFLGNLEQLVASPKNRHIWKY